MNAQHAEIRITEVDDRFCLSSPSSTLAKQCDFIEVQQYTADSIQLVGGACEVGYVP